jgi:hypothetical protein
MPNIESCSKVKAKFSAFHQIGHDPSATTSL